MRFKSQLPSLLPSAALFHEIVKVTSRVKAKFGLLSISFRSFDPLVIDPLRSGRHMLQISAATKANSGARDFSGSDLRYEGETGADI